MSPRPFRILGVQQIAVGGLDRAALRGFWVELLGLTPVSGFRSEAENVDEEILSIGSGPLAVEVDLMQPIDPEARPRVHEPALNHVGLWVDDLPAAVAWLSAQGVRLAPGGIRRGAAGHEICFVHPKGSAEAPHGAGGVLLELVQAPDAVRAALGGARPSGRGAQRSLLRRLLQRGTVVLVTTLVTLAALEIATRALKLGRLPKPHGTGSIFFEEDDPDYLHIPGAQQTRYSQADWDAEVVVKTAHIGPHGFRASDFPAEKAAGVLRVACTGDSMTFGRGVNDDETWPAQLQRALEPALDGPVEVWNCGVEGTDTVDHVGMVRDYILRYDPDLVLLGFYINDVECGPLPRRDSTTGPLANAYIDFVRPTSGWWKDCQGFLRSKSVLVDTLFERLHRQLDGEVTVLVYNAAYERDSIGWKRCKKSLLEIRDLLAGRGVGFGVVLLPMMLRVREGQLASRTSYAIVQAFCRAEGIPVLDAEPLFAGRDPLGLVVHPLDLHWNAEAFAILAPAVAPFLAEHGLLALGARGGRTPAGDE